VSIRRGQGWNRNVEGFEIVVRRFDFWAFDDGEADRNEDVFDFLEDLADQVMGAEGANDAGERRSIRSLARAVFGTGLDGARRVSICDSNCARARLERRRQRASIRAWRVQPIVRDLREYAGFAAEPASRIVSRKIVLRGSAIGVEAYHGGQRRARRSSGPRDAEMDEGSAVLFSVPSSSFKANIAGTMHHAFRKNLSRAVKSQDAMIIAGFIALKFADAEEFLGSDDAAASRNLRDRYAKRAPSKKQLVSASAPAPA